MNKYKSLVSNTLIFAISAFSSKLMVFILAPLMTYLLDPGGFGAVRNAIDTCVLFLPVVYLCVSESIIRFGLDDAYRKSDVFTTGILTLAGGYLIFLFTMPLLAKWSYIKGYEWLVPVYVFASASRTVITHFVRSGGLVRVFAIDGVTTSASLLGFVYLYLVVLKMGSAGYMLAVISSDALSGLGLFLFLRLHRFIKVKGLQKSTAKAMLVYSAPLVPTAVSWWVINISSQFFVTTICGLETVGLYLTAATVPNVIMIVSALFIQAWQISAFSEKGGKEREKFFSTVFRSYYSIIFLAAAGIILLIRPVTGLLFQEDYYESWRYVPFRVLAVSFSCFVTFLGTVYNSVKKNGMVTVTTAIGALLNFALNWLIIPAYGAIGAGAATFISYLTVFIIRAVDTRKHIRIQMQPVRIAASLALLLLQTWVCLNESDYGILWQIIIILALTLCNLGYLIFLSQKLLSAVKINIIPPGYKRAKRRNLRRL